MFLAYHVVSVFVKRTNGLQLSTSYKVGREDDVAELHAGERYVVAYSFGKLNAVFGKGMFHELAAIHLRRVSVVVVVVEEDTSAKQFLCGAGTLICNVCIFESHDASFGCPYREEELLQRLHLHPVFVSVEVWLIGNGMYDHWLAVLYHHNATMGIVGAFVGKCYGMACKTCSFP